MVACAWLLTLVSVPWKLAVGATGRLAFSVIFSVFVSFKSSVRVNWTDTMFFL